MAQVERVIDKLPRVDIPAEWVDFLVPWAGLATLSFSSQGILRLTDVHVLMAMMVIKGIYKEYEVKSLNHGIALGLRNRIAPSYLWKA